MADQPPGPPDAARTGSPDRVTPAEAPPTNPPVLFVKNVPPAQDSSPPPSRSVTDRTTIFRPVGRRPQDRVTFARSVAGQGHLRTVGRRTGSPSHGRSVRAGADRVTFARSVAGQGRLRTPGRSVHRPGQGGPYRGRAAVGLGANGQGRTHTGIRSIGHDRGMRRSVLRQPWTGSPQSPAGAREGRSSRSGGGGRPARRRRQAGVDPCSWQTSVTLSYPSPYVMCTSW